MLNQISPSRTYVAVMTLPNGGHHIIEYVVPAELKNTLVARNSFHRLYLEHTPNKEAGLFAAFVPIEQWDAKISWDDYLAKLKATAAQEAGMTVSSHLTIELVKKTNYSVDASLYYEALDDCNPETIGIEAFNPNNSNICFRHSELQSMGGVSDCYLDLIWALDADSAEAAQSFVAQQLPKVIPTPSGLKQVRVEVGGVYSHITKVWEIENA